MRKKLSIMIFGAATLIFIMLTSQYVSADVNKVVDTNLEYDPNVGDEFVYEYTFSEFFENMGESETESETGYRKEIIANKTIFAGGEKVNLTVDEQIWDNTYKFDIDAVNDPSYWHSPHRTSDIKNASLMKLVDESMFVLPADVKTGDLICNDLIDVFIYYMVGEDGREGLKTSMEEGILSVDVSVDEDLQREVDEPYGFVSYRITAEGTNDTSDLYLKMSLSLSFEVKLNDFGILEDVQMKFRQDILIKNSETEERFIDGAMAMGQEYHLVWASEDKYITDDFTPYWNVGPSWFAENWGWLLLGVATITAFTVFIYSSRVSCENLKDPKKVWSCKK